MAFTLLIAMAAGLLFGLAPAFQVRSHRLHDALIASGRGLVAGAQQRARQALVVGEIALSLMLLVGATLLIQSFARMQRVDVGFRSAAVLTLDRIELPPGRAAAASSAAFFESLVRALRNVPGVEAAAVTLGLPLDPRASFFVDESTFSIPGQPPVPAAERPSAPLHVVSADYFAVIGVPLKAGRWFTERDGADTPGVVIINETMARRFWPNDNPIGRRIAHDLSIVPRQQTVREIVGVVGDVRHFAVERAAEPQMFVPHAQMPWPSMAVVLRSRLDAQALTREVRETVWSMDGTLPVPPLRGLDDLFAGAVGQPRFRAWLLGAVRRHGRPAGHDGVVRHDGLQRAAAHSGDRFANGARRHAATGHSATAAQRLDDRGAWHGARSRRLIRRRARVVDDAVWRRNERPGHVHRRTGVARRCWRLSPATCHASGRRLDPLKAINANS